MGQLVNKLPLGTHEVNTEHTSEYIAGLHPPTRLLVGILPECRSVKLVRRKVGRGGSTLSVRNCHTLFLLTQKNANSLVCAQSACARGIADF